MVQASISGQLIGSSALRLSEYAFRMPTSEELLLKTAAEAMFAIVDLAMRGILFDTSVAADR